MKGFGFSIAAAILAIGVVYAVFGPLPSWAVIPLGLFIAVPLVLWWRGYWQQP